MTRESMRILMIARTPLVRELGGGRIQLEVGEALTALGHEVEFFDVTAALGGARARRRDRLDPLRFARRAREFVRRHPDRWDVIDADHGDLPYSKRQLSFRGLLVARSSGLYAFYRDFKQLERRRWPERIPGSRLGRAVNRVGYERAFSAGERAMRLCDLAIVPTEAERDFLSRELGIQDRCVILPFGLTDERRAAFAAARQSPAKRLESATVAFVGTWTLRKGSADWAEIVRRVRDACPSARFLFAGTGAGADEVLDDLFEDDRAAVTVVPTFASGDLPQLLAGATVAAFPSYVEGFPFGVLESLAAGLPTVAYDAFGARVILSESGMLVPPGNVDALAAKIVEILTLDPRSYDERSRRGIDVAAGYRWREIAERTASAYSAALSALRNGG